MLQIGRVSAIFCRYLFNKSLQKNFTQSIETGSHRAADWYQWPCTLSNIWGRYVKLVNFSRLVCFTIYLTAFYVNALNSSYRRLLFYRKAVGFYTVSIQVLIFGSILPISHQHIASEKIVHSAFKQARRKLHLDISDHFHRQIWGGGEFKTRRFSRSSQKLDHFLKQNNQLSPKVQQHFKNDFIWL